MCVTNLLINRDSFGWEDLTVDRSVVLEDFILAYGESEANGDSIYNHPEIFAFNLSWGLFHQIAYWNEIERNRKAPWLNRDSQKYLLKIIQRLPTPQPSYNLNDLESEFPGDNNGLIGVNFSPNANPLKHLYDKPTWQNFHRDFVTSDPRIRVKCNEYFIKFYVPKLTEDVSKINQLIRENKVDSIFKRLDNPKLTADGTSVHGQQCHMHFNDKNESALNIDGTWKHGKFKIPTDAKDQLEQWGFIIP